MSSFSSFFRRSFPYLLVLPAFAWVVLICFYPTAYTIWLSFQKGEYATIHGYAGLTNFIKLFTNSYFYKVLYNTVYLTFFSLSIRLLVGFCLALILASRSIKWRRVILTLLLIPWAISGVVTSILIKWMFDPGFGLINYILLSLGIITRPLSVLASQTSAMWTIILCQVWASIPYIAIVFVANIESIPPDQYESATVDGANFLQRMRHITLPWIKPAFQYLLVLQTIFLLRSFLFIYILTQGGPAGGTEVLGTWLFRLLFQTGDLGLASALSVFMLCLNAVIALIYTSLIKVRIY